MEKWKDIKGYEGIYQVSNLGRVMSLSNNKTKKQKILKLYTDRKGYFKIKLTNNGVRRSYFAHQLVAMAFLNHKPNGNTIVVDHIDFNKHNNSVNNLRLISHHNNSIRTRRNLPNLYRKQKTKENFLRHILELVPL